MKKKELVTLLKKGIYWEDNFVLNYDNPSFWTLIKTSVPKENFKRIRELFSLNINESYKHETVLKNLIEKILKDNKNEY
jgi:hypothetical protein